MKPFARILLFVIPLLLAGCQTTMQRIAACKAGDWKTIGYDDGLAGKAADFAERKEFCDAHNDDKAKAGDAAAADYQAGWAQGNWNLWAALGEEDGSKGQLSQFEVRTAQLEGAKAPQNRPAYDSGGPRAIANTGAASVCRKAPPANRCSRKTPTAAMPRRRSYALTKRPTRTAGMPATACSGRTPA
jgi:poly-gamma-glutamate capsule biosynthesis protein CapA/YwtB (metallophosphatase superfamily)